MLTALYQAELTSATWLVCCVQGLEHLRQSRIPAITRSKGFEPLTSVLGPL